MKNLVNVSVKGLHDKPILLDVCFKETNIQKPILIFCHGYKGFKDWGPWNIMAQKFANNNICCIKFNFSYNGGTPEQPIDFPDLIAFGENNYTKELDDLECVLDWVEDKYGNHPEFNTANITLLGHSRGGGIVTIKASEDSRISKIISLAGVSDFENRFPKNEALEKWKNEGVFYVKNGRTKQDMPHFYQFYEDFIKNQDRLNIKRASQNLKMPHLIIHGNSDTSVHPEEAKKIHAWNSNSKLTLIDGADHVFNTKHPWEKDSLTKELDKVVKEVSAFVKKSGA
jgi:pimeloyl-ACP methyl ester carboxylesterase